MKMKFSIDKNNNHSENVGFSLYISNYFYLFYGYFSHTFHGLSCYDIENGQKGAGMGAFLPADVRLFLAD